MTSRLSSLVPRASAPLALALAASLAQGCGGGAPAPAPPRRVEARAPSPPRYFITSAYGAQTLGGERASGRDVVLVEGKRVVLRGGEIVSVLRDRERLDGLRPLPRHLGGGLVAWNAGGAFHAEKPEGPLTALEGAAPRGGVRPWLDGLVLRTPQGLVVSKKGAPPARLEVRGAGLLVDALAADAERAAVLDAFGRARVTVDGGATWLDASTERRATTDALSLDSDGTLVLRGRPTLVVEPPPAGARAKLEERTSSSPRLGVKPRGGRTRSIDGAMEDALPFALELAEHAVARGVFLAGAEPTGDRLLLAHEGRLAMVSAHTLSWLHGAPLHELDETSCQATSVGGELVAACSSVNGSLALSLESRLGRARTEATFRKPSDGFVAGDDALLHLGPCGSEEPSLTDLDVEPSSPNEYPGYYPDPPAAPERALPRDPPPDDHRLVCLRRPGGSWEPHGLYGRDARQLHRFVVGGDGRIVALVLDELEVPPDEERAKKRDPLPPADPAVRVIRVKVNDPALAGARLAALRVSPRDGSAAQIDREFWLEGEGVVRGWAHLPEGWGQEGFEPPPPLEPSPSLPDLVSSELGGPAAGVRIHPSGKVELLPPPKKTTRVIHGGRFALAMSDGDEGVTLFHESTDGGATWREIEGPPFGGIDPFIDAFSPAGCSAVGCVLGRGLVRLGWGGGARREALPEPESPTLAGERGPIGVTCTLERALVAAAPPAKPSPKPAPKPTPPPTSPPSGPGKPLGAPPAPGPPGKKGKPPAPKAAGPVALDEPAGLLAIGTAGPKARGVADPTGWSVRMVRPFSAEPASLARAPFVPTVRESLAAPVLGGKGPSMFASVGERAAHFTGPPAKAEPLTHEGARVARAVELAGGVLVTLDLDRRSVGFARPGAGPRATKGAAPGLGDASGGALGELFSPSRGDDPFGLKLSLGLPASSDDGGEGAGPFLLVYAPGSGQLEAVSIDVGGARVRGASRTLPSLGELDVDARCAPGPRPLRAVLELPVLLELSEPGAPPKRASTYGALVLVRAGAARVCLEGLELDTLGSDGLHLSVSNVPGKVRARAYRGLAEAQATCTLTPRPPPPEGTPRRHPSKAQK